MTHVSEAADRLQSLAKTAALLADATVPPPDPVATVTYASRGRTLIIGSASLALPIAKLLSTSLSVCVLVTDEVEEDHAAALSAQAGSLVLHGKVRRIQGWLGAFEVQWQPMKSAGGEKEDGRGNFDLVLDLSPAPVISLHQPPQGYFAPGSEPSAQMSAVVQLAQMVGEFEKPRYFHYKERLCAHGRNQIDGCNACIETCSAAAINPVGDRVRVEPHLCMGCGACTTVCPSGALTYAYPNASHTGRRLKAMLAAYIAGGGKNPLILFHSEKRGSTLIHELERQGRMAGQSGIPARVIPVEVHHAASVGIDLWLAAIAYGAGGIAVLTTDEEAPQYREALARQMHIAQTILSGLGYDGAHLGLIQASTPAELAEDLRRAPQGDGPQQLASFHVAADKRNTLDFVLDHLYRYAPSRKDLIALPAGSPFGAVVVDTAACTLCMSCVGACPESALLDGQNAPQLRFVEKNCVQCGLCEKTCPEQAITLAPRIAFSDEAKKAVVLNESQPFSCIRCAKPFGTVQMIENMLGRLSQHGAFAGNLDRLKMCGDCRVVDMMTTRRETRIVEVKPPPVER